ncbi:hypothetical protein [Rhizobium flavescens]|uniref:hypothetical protein n=1 Tax=Rhizobium flavescens TaxID=2607407 RepID=UPI00140A39D7|nr:hypothetical protein [Rhizobium flavescens]
MSRNTQQHSYQEIRGAIVDIITSETGSPEQWTSLTLALGDELERRASGTGSDRPNSFGPNLSKHDEELARDAFWDLVRQGMVTIGLDGANDKWPFFRLSHLGRTELLSRYPLRFHDAKSYLGHVEAQVPDLSSVAKGYLIEAINAFYADLPLSACVMLGVAAEAEFIRMVDAAAANSTHGSRFHSAQKAEFIGTKATRFRSALETIRANLPKESTENLEVLTAIQSIIRTARNDAGHPVAKAVNRQQVFVLLHLFVDMARQVEILRKALTELQ